MRYWNALLHALALALVGHAFGQDQAAERAALLKKREELNATVWAQETEAQRHEQTLVALWDALLGAQRSPKPTAYDIFAALPLQAVTPGKPKAAKTLDHGIEEVRFETGKPLDPKGWKAWLAALEKEGYRLRQSEWHHAKFEKDAQGAARSEVTVVLHATHASKPGRWAVDGAITVWWSGKDDASGHPIPQSVDLSGLRLLRRAAAPGFEPWLKFDPSQPGKAAGIHPLLVHDLDGDGKSEIIAAGANKVFFLGADGKFQERAFLADWERCHEAGVLADVTGDGTVDHLTPSLKGDMLLYVGEKGGQFPTPAKGRSKNGGPLQQPTAMTVGDIDLDGDLDLWVGQYRISYARGVMPTPFHDANDGFPAFLLINQGGGKFAEGAEAAGLTTKQNRRTYTGCLVDLDDDHDLDLMVVSDFAGVDLWRNNGKGVFEDITEKALDERRLFGMSATLADYNLDGRLDFYVAGMGSTTARRLEFMGAKRGDDPQVDALRMTMGYGNRMYLRGEGGVYRQPEFKDSVARTGWTWGTTSLDFDNDGDKDIFVANGHSSGKSTKDHCTHFWCHDIYKPLSKPSLAMHQVFQTVHEGYFNRTESWDGYQKNNLLMNQDGKSFLNIAWLMGVADEFDGRAALSEDLDGDGKPDLLTVEDRWSDGQLLHVHRNVFPTKNHWIGLRLSEQGAISPIGAMARVLVKGRAPQVGAIVTGETLHGQHSTQLHFGLGQTQEVEAIEVTWPGGKTKRLDKPAVDRYHTVTGD